jgi:hypothetical protein
MEHTNRCFRIEEDASANTILRPIHRADVKLGIGREARDAFTRQTQPCVEIDDRLEPEVDRGLVDARTVAVEVGCNAFKSARAIEHGRAEPEPMGAWPHDRHIALVPSTLEKGPCLRMADGVAIWNHDGPPYGRRHNEDLLWPKGQAAQRARKMHTPPWCR